MSRGDGPPSRGPKLPHTFRSLDLLRRLNIAAVGLSLAAATATIFSRMIGTPNEYGTVAIVTGFPTLVLGLLWAKVLRSRKTVGKSKFRQGWILSIPLAALNAAFACGFLLACESGSDPVMRFFLGMFAGATFGALFWVPALLATFLFFGLPVSWSQDLAAKGLAGEERGERVMGIASTLLGIGAFAIFALWGEISSHPRHSMLDMMGNIFLMLAPVLAVATGASATVFAQARERRRRHFVSEVESGHVEGFRVEQVPEGKVLVRVSALGGSAYRVANFEEEVYALDEEGAAREEKRAIALPRRDG